MNLSQPYTRKKNGMWKCIYEIEGDTLAIAYSKHMDERLNSFDGDYYCVEIYKRVKK